jgi:integrase
VASSRRVKLGPTVVAALRAHKARQAAERLRVGRDYWADLDLVFANRIGEPLDETMLATRTFKPAAKRAGVPDATLYDLRHTHATHALTATADPVAVAARLGHASAKMTLDVYGHALPDRVAAVADAVEGALFGDGRR